jgi:hypothetical protein
LSDPKLQFNQVRTTINLKDKWRTIQQQGSKKRKNADEDVEEIEED